MNPVRFRTAFFLLVAAAEHLLFQTGCAGGLGSVTVVSPLPDSAKVQPGNTIGVMIPDARAHVSFEQTSGRVGSAGSGAEHGIKTLAGAGWSGEAAVVGVALLPIAALVGAVAEVGRELSPQDREKSEVALDAGLRAAATQSEFQDHFLQVAAGQTHLKFIKLASAVTAARESHDHARSQPILDWFLELTVEEMRLRRTSLSDDYGLIITTRARLIRAADAAVVYDKPIEFHSSTSRSVDWSANNGTPLRRVAEYGYRMIAEQILKRILAAPPR